MDGPGDAQNLGCSSLAACIVNNRWWHFGASLTIIFSPEPEYEQPIRLKKYGRGKLLRQIRWASFN